MSESNVSVEHVDNADNNNMEGTGDKVVQGLNDMQSQLTKITSPADYIHSLPKTVQRRIKALKKLQLETFRLETKFYGELHELEAKYEQLYQPYFKQRYEIISAAVEPTEEECSWISDDDDNSLDKSDSATLNNNQNAGNPVSGIPCFWLQIFKNVDILSILLQTVATCEGFTSFTLYKSSLEVVDEHDEPILMHLKDISMRTLTDDKLGFRLEFHFEPNEYFTNAVLTKDYEYKFAVDDLKPLEFDGPEIVKCKGCHINWNPEKNVTVKKVKKIQQHRTHGSKRTVIKSVPNDSFFNFFTPPEVAEGTEPDDETEEILSNDFEIGHFIRDQIIPKAVLYFTGEALDYSDDEESYESSGADEQDSSS